VPKTGLVLLFIIEERRYKMNLFEWAVGIGLGLFLAHAPTGLAWCFLTLILALILIIL